jgi:hypothetical protein
LYLESNTGTAISVAGQAMYMLYGFSYASLAPQTISGSLSTSAGSLGGVATGAGYYMQHQGDIIQYIVSDVTYGFMYRVTAQQYSVTSSTNYNVVIEQLG